MPVQGSAKAEALRQGGSFAVKKRHCTKARVYDVKYLADFISRLLTPLLWRIARIFPRLG